MRLLHLTPNGYTHIRQELETITINVPFYQETKKAMEISPALTTCIELMSMAHQSSFLTSTLVRIASRMISVESKYRLPLSPALTMARAIQGNDDYFLTLDPAFTIQPY